MIDPNDIIPYPYPCGPLSFAGLREKIEAKRLADLGAFPHDGKRHVLHVAVDAGGCGWYRAFTPAELFQGSPRYAVVAGNTISDELLNWADIVLWQRHQQPSSARIATVLKSHGKPSIFELDDNLFIVPKHNPAYRGIMSKATQTGLVRMLQTCDAIVATNDALGSVLRVRHERRVPYHAIPNAYLPERFPTVPNTTGKVRVGWAGSSSHVRDLELILPALRSIGQRSDVTVVILGWDGLIRYPDKTVDVLAGIPHEHHPWARISQYPTTLAGLALDIGLAPIKAEPFNTFKSEVKWEEYTSVGAATIASNFGPYARAITHGHDGLLAASADEFTAYAHELVDNAAKRRELAAHAHATCDAAYGHVMTQAKYELLYDSLIDAGRTPLRSSV